MGFIYQEANAYGVEALVALERHYTPTEEKYCTAVTEAVRICDTYGIPERELVPQVRHIAAAEEYLLAHLSEDEETLQFLFTPLSGSNTCLAWFLVWDHVRPGGEKAYKYTGHTPQQRLRDIISAVGQYQEDPLPPPQQLDTICDLIDYMDLTRLPPADRWRLLTLYAHLEEYERTACRIVEQSAALLAQVMQTPETDRLLRQCLEQTRENTPRLMSAFAQSQTLSDQSITFLPCVMSFNSMRFLTGDDHITVIAGVLYWLILRLTEKYAANDEHLLACLKTLGDKSRLDILKLLKEQDRSGQELAKELGISQGTVSHHLNVLVRDEFMDEAEKTSLKAEHITISPNGDTYMDGVELVSVSQMRNASALHFTVTNADGQEVWSDAVTNVPKTIYVSSQGGPIPATMYQDMAPDAWYGTDNQGSALPDGQYYYTITADPVTDHESRNVRDTLTFPVYIDTQAPQLDQGCVTLSTGADGRTTLGMQVSDEHLYLDTEIFVANDDGTISTNSEKLLHKNVGLADMPDVTSDAVSVDVTDYAGKLLYVQLTDWGYNYAAYLVQLPDTFEGTTLSLSDTTAFLFTGEQQQLVAFDTDTDTALTWTSSNADVASVDGSGLVTAKAPGVTTVTATTANGASVSCVVGVSDQLTYTGLRLDFTEMTTTMYFDSTIDLPGVYLEPYGFALSGKHNTYGTDGLTWSVSDPTIADLDEYSKTTLVANKDGKSGDVTVTAEYQGMTASFTVHVGPYPGSVELYHTWIQARSNRIFLQGKQGIVGAGRDGIHATDTAATSDDQIITFTNSDPNVVDLTNPVIRATSNRDLPDECAYVDARNPGNAVITATATSTTQDTVQCFVTVVPKWYDGIQATQDTIQLKLGQGADLTQYLTLLDESGVVIPELNPVNYASLDESILSVDASGHVTALHTGTGMVRALLNTGDYALIAVEVTCDHDHTTRTETPAACTQDGSVTVTCDDCDEVLSTETLPATGHSTVVKNAKDATCTEPGYTGDKVCTVCGETVETGEVIPAAGHSYKDGKCTVCGAADPNANSGGNTGNHGTDSPNTADGAAMGLWLSLMTVAALAGAVLVLGKRYRHK